METPSVYTSIVSPRSRRLRTTGVVLLCAVLAMALYGYFSLMPAIERTVRESAASGSSVAAATARGRSDALLRQASRSQRARKLQVAVALAYWGVCGLLLISVLFVAWLDFREITRTYVDQRRAMWVQAAEQVKEPEDAA